MWKAADERYETDETHERYETYETHETYETEASCDGGRASVRQKFLRLRHQSAATRKFPTLQRLLACGCGAV